MTDGTPARDFLLPGLQQLVREAGKRGISREVAVAVLIDLVTGGAFNAGPPEPDPEPDEVQGRETPIDELQAGVVETMAHPENPLRGVKLLDRNFHPRGRGRGR